MQSVEMQLAECREKVFAAEKKKGFSEAATQTAWNDRMKKCGSVEEKLSVAKKHLASFGESRPRITRNNGSGSSVVESDHKAEIERAAKEFHVSIQEATVILGLPASATEKSEVSDLAEAWAAYCRTLTESQALTLAKRGVPVPTE